MKSPKPPQKFFERFLDNDLDDLFEYLQLKQLDILAGNVDTIPTDKISEFDIYNGPSTQLCNYYNIFDFDNSAITKLKEELKSATKEACDYYGIEFESQNFHIHGWFNLDYQSPENKETGVSPLKHPEHYHDHMGGEGAPVFHGYYCVNAEPSITYYKIDRLIDFENINKNNRAVLSETGHPHGRDDWYFEKPRITIAYDIAPGGHGSIWQKL